MGFKASVGLPYLDGLNFLKARAFSSRGKCVGAATFRAAHRPERAKCPGSFEYPRSGAARRRPAEGRRIVRRGYAPIAA